MALGKAAPARVILIRGWQDLYSEGIDQLAMEIAQHGIATEVFRANQWEDVADKLAHSSSTGPLALIGFSYGADDVILVARKLHDEHRPVDLLITIDPVTPKPVPDNVQHCFNYYQSNGVWDALPWLRGVPLESAPNVENANLRSDRKDLLQPDTSHATIAGNALLHREIVKRVVEWEGAPAADALLFPRPPLRGWAREGVRPIALSGIDRLTSSRQKPPPQPSPGVPGAGEEGRASSHK